MSHYNDIRPMLDAAGAVFGGDGNAPLHFGSVAAEESALASGAGVTPCLGRTQVGLRGADRVSFLHNLCSNDIRGLKPGSGCEAFLLNAQGKILLHVFVFAEEEQLVLDTVPEQSEFLTRHLDRYLIREKVEIVPLTTRCELLVAGARGIAAFAKLEVAPLPAEHAGHISATITGTPVSIRKVDLAGPESWLISLEAADVEVVWRALLGAGIVPCGALAAEAARIAAGAPHFGQDITDANLPQEVHRDRLAISFTKGCYIGQETVARIDALGHVNRLLVALVGDGAKAPEVGLELQDADGKASGAVTSAAFSHRLGRPIALGYVRRQLAKAGTEVQSASGPFVVTATPIV